MNMNIYRISMNDIEKGLFKIPKYIWQSSAPMKRTMVYIEYLLIIILYSIGFEPYVCIEEETLLAGNKRNEQQKIIYNPIDDEYFVVWIEKVYSL